MKKIFISITAMVIFSACQKEGSSPRSVATTNPGSPTEFSSSFPRVDGTYSGTYLLSEANPTISPVEKPVQITFSGDNFHTGDPNVFITVGDGSIQIDNNVFAFTNVDAFPSNPAIVNAALTGNYKYTIKGDSLLLSKEQNGATFSYKLEKQ
jgi:hypothetical protein